MYNFILFKKPFEFKFYQNYLRYKQFNKDVITVAVGYYLRYALSYRDISEILRERGVNVHHST
ncbi:hypothetical protein LZU15_11830, partial [Staphylococcus epidermidis]|nr:hypothetical protein [Staphylococcus epidermidis]